MTFLCQNSRSHRGRWIHFETRPSNGDNSSDLHGSVWLFFFYLFSIGDANWLCLYVSALQLNFVNNVIFSKRYEKDSCSWCNAPLYLIIIVAHFWSRWGISHICIRCGYEKVQIVSDFQTWNKNVWFTCALADFKTIVNLFNI